MGTEQEKIFPHLRVLVVDDHMIMRKMIMDGLRALGVTHINNLTGKDALQEIRDRAEIGLPYHVVLLDWHMPDVDGITILSACRSQKMYDRTAIVMVTAEQERKNILKAIESGATSYIIKPVTQDMLRKTLIKTVDWLVKKDVADFVPKQKKADALTPQKMPSDLTTVIAKGVQQIFSEMFQVQLISHETAEHAAAGSFVCVGHLHQKNFRITLRLLFERNLLAPLLRQFYTPDMLEEQAVYDDLACEIVNMLCGRVKAFLNSHGYELLLAFPEMGDPATIEDSDTTLNICFSLNESRYFLVDLKTENQ